MLTFSHLTRRLAARDLRRTIRWAVVLAGLPISIGTHASQPGQVQNRLSAPVEDAARVERLMKGGVRLDAGRITAWFSPDAMAPEEMKAIADRLEKGLQALEDFLHVPRRWQDARQRKVDYFFDAGPFFVPHATVKRQVLVPIGRLRDGQAPLLHETTHAILTPPQGRRPLAWLTEGLATYVAKAVSAKHAIPEGDTFENGSVDEFDARCAFGLATAQGPRILPFIGQAGNLPDLYAMEPAREVRQAFYGCSASFTKYLVDRIGLERVIDVLSEGDPHKKLEQLSGEKMLALRVAWTTKIGPQGLR